MKRLALHLLACLALLAGSLPAFAAWNADWPHRAKVSLNTAAGGVQLTQAVAPAVVLVRLHSGNFQFLDAKSDGSDLRFIASDDKTPLKFHVEKFDGLNELALVWVQVPQLNPGAKDDFVWAYYGNKNAPAASDPRGTYDLSQGLVYHFAEGESVPQDATANGNHAAASTATIGTAGLIGAAASFDGQQQIEIAVTPSLRASAPGKTVSMWVKPGDAAQGTLFSQQDGDASLALSLRNGQLVATAGALSAAAAGALTPGAWSHVALVVDRGLVLYVNGNEAARAASDLVDLAGRITIGAGFRGEIDELQVSTAARAVDSIRLAALSQGPDQKLVAVSAAAAVEAEGASYMRILLSAVTIDGWVVIAILGVMLVHATWVVIEKVRFINRVARENRVFLTQFDRLINGIRPEQASIDGAGADAAGDGDHRRGPAARYRHSQLYHLYNAGVTELMGRFETYRAQGRPLSLTPQTLSAIRATVEARLVREVQRLNSQMVVLTIAIAGGPFLGLLGTVVGVMITFAAIAAAGDVNVNAIAPGIAAALVATVAGLAVAIPALFAYNYLTGRISALIADMQVFVDELSTRIAENHSA